MTILRHNWKGIISISILLLIFGSSLLAPLLVSQDPYEQSLQNILVAPLQVLNDSGKLSVLGTDQLGRDVLSRLLYGGRVSLLMSVVSVIFSGIVGSLVGIIAGYYGGLVDSLLMRLGDIQLSIPSMLLAIVMVAVFGSNFFSIIFVLAITGWVSFARVLRSRVIALKELEFIQAAVTMGVPHPIIITRHIFPNISYLFFTQAALQMSRMILLAASLSFLGLGVAISTPTWGGMINDGREYIASAWWLSIFPSLAIAITIFTVNLFSDFLKEKL